ncbi:hypothetical protein DUNSADRAFT_11791 [Dunaliella salina]|uniref:Uncharacterized protein n=1 Tax=Dunaliella salina TaxID=3046 RepID=A0ABQ7GCQ0_DUNSA|nr:hypothetical protein DUNSADRAFT_11791 [Dunaliella salina]|eukprot:KAF5832349.1 hypothetical protein DUNSADRAFT_11791 [Dunaliella salina]
MVRNDKILFKTEAVRAVISEARAVLIRNRPGKSFETTLKIVQEAIDGEEEDSVPFELNMLEALLFLTSSYFDVRIGHLNFMYDGVVADMRESSEPFSAVASEAMLQQLTPLDKAITASGQLPDLMHQINHRSCMLCICFSARDQLPPELLSAQLHSASSPTPLMLH